MPTNLPPQYFEVEQRYRQAKTVEEKIATLREMLATMPKHKGTDKLQADLRARISKLTREGGRRKGPHRRSQSRTIARQGAGQVMLVGPPNSGKSTLLCSLTRAHSEVAPYPFTTYDPVVGMMSYEDVLIQLVDTPPIADEYEVPWLAEVLQTGDLYLVVVDLSKDEVLEQLETVIDRMQQLRLVNFPSSSSADADEHSDDERGKILLCGNKYDSPGGESRLTVLTELYGRHWRIVHCSAQTAEGLELLKKAVYETLGILRVYTKAPGKAPDMTDPVVLKEGAVVLDAARAIHKELAVGLKYARIWSREAFDGQRVDREHPLQDKDVLEFHV
jgi:ribosome-interacting GTPase 1